MTMNYQKMTIPAFQERLKQNAYKGITGARRAIGKADWSPELREKAHLIANKHYKITDGGRPAKSSGRQDGRARPSAPRAPAGAVRTTTADGVVSAHSSRDRSGTPSTNAEIVDLCGTANELTETIRKSSEVAIEARPTLVKATELLFECLELVAGALKGDRGASGKAANLTRTLQNLGSQVRPQSHIHRRGEDPADQDEDERSVAAGR